MCYICGKSRNKIAHSQNCGYVKLIPVENRKVFERRQMANDAGYEYCKCCSSIMKYVRNEKRALEDYCRATGIRYTFNRGDGSLDIKSKIDDWKIITKGVNNVVMLYHKNQYDGEEESVIPGYHRQKVFRTSLVKYMEYIAGHDIFRELNPLDQGKKKSKRNSTYDRRQSSVGKKKADKMSKIRKLRKQNRKDSKNRFAEIAYWEYENIAL